MVMITEFEVSVVVLTYKADFRKLEKTLESIINQKNIVLEIVISDDGSNDSIENFVNGYFERKKFNNFKLVINKNNRGTVYNYLSGLEVASGDYVKLISPGDNLNGTEVLREWIDFMYKSDFEWSFSDAIYYHYDNDIMIPVQSNAYPNNIQLYMKGNVENCRWNYVVLKDYALGATMLGKREIQLQYCRRIVGKVIYAEDNIWRMMMFDGIVGGYFPKETILYEYGTGVSTSNSTKWQKRLTADWEAANLIMFSDISCMTDFQKKMYKGFNCNSYIRKLFVKGIIINKLRYIFFRRKTKNKIKI